MHTALHTECRFNKKSLLRRYFLMFLLARIKYLSCITIIDGMCDHSLKLHLLDSFLWLSLDIKAIFPEEYLSSQNPYYRLYSFFYPLVTLLLGHLWLDFGVWLIKDIIQNKILLRKIFLSLRDLLKILQKAPNNFRNFSTCSVIFVTWQERRNERHTTQFIQTSKKIHLVIQKLSRKWGKMTHFEKKNKNKKTKQVTTVDFTKAASSSGQRTICTKRMFFH